MDDYRHNPVLREPRRYRQPLADQIRGYKRLDPKAKPQYAVPVSVIEHIHHQAHTTPNPHWSHQVKTTRAATADLITVAFYFLLRVGEYTRPAKSRSDTLTVPFRVGDITLRDANHHRIDPTAPLEQLLTATEATMKIENQKNGMQGGVIHQEATGLPHCPIKALARRIHNIMSNGGTLFTPIYQSYTAPGKAYYISPQQVTAMVRDAAGAIGMYEDTIGFKRSDISSHSLRAGGAMAMHLNGASMETIKKVGRWKGDTFLMYIHDQISAFTTGLSTQMSNRIPFRQIAGPTLLEQSNQAHLRHGPTI